ncbi:MAG: hypothetical protein ACK5SQ_00495 [Chitinophagales bacterium]
MSFSLPPRFVTGVYLFILLLTSSQLTGQACPGLGSITLNVVASPQPSLNFPTVLCPGATGTVSVNQSFTQYAWSTGGNGQSITINTPGTYTVTVTNSAGCTATAEAEVQASSTPPQTITQSPYGCNGNIVLNATPGFSTYAWSNGGGSGTSATYASSGLYSLTVTDNAGCTVTAFFQVTIPPAPVVTISGNTSVCSGNSSTLSASPGFSSYNWSSGQNTSSIEVTASGSYSVTATDAFGCTTTTSTTLQVLPFTPPSISGPSVLCEGTSASLSVVGGPYASVQWSTGSTATTIAVSDPGVYSVTVTEANGCTGTASINLAPGGSTQTSIIGTPTLCSGAATTLIATGSFASYSWSNGETGSILTVTTPGLYTVTVTNSSGCTGTASQTVIAVTPPPLSITGPTSICPNGVIVLAASPGFVSYFWAGGTGQFVFVANPGTYTVTGTDANGCTATAQTTIIGYPGPSPSITGSTSICDGSSTLLSVTPAFNNYTWSTGATTASVEVFSSGTYSVIVTDSDGCQGSVSVQVTQGSNPVASISEAPYLCNNQLVLETTPGFTSYNWSTGSTASNTTILSNGTYSLTVTNAEGCTGTSSYNAVIPNPPVVSVSGATQLCPGSSTPLSASPGLTDYVWSSSQTGQIITVTSAGTYSVTASDANGCTTTAQTTIVGFPAPIPSINGTTSFCEGSSTLLSVTPAFVTYNWSTGASTAGIEVFNGGNYSVIVTDANGCEAAVSVQVTEVNDPEPPISEEPYLCNDQLVLSTVPGFTTYNWSNGSTDPSTTIVSDGNYSLTVTNAQGCTGVTSYTAIIPSPPSINISGVSQLCLGSSTVLTASSGLIDYVWSTSQTGQSITINSAGNYSVTASDSYGCTTSSNISLTAVPAPSVTISGPTSICAGGSATFSVAGSFSNYLWSNNTNGTTIVVSDPGTYSVTVTAANGCTGTDSQQLDITNTLSPQISEAPYNCDGLLTLDAGVGYSTYEWSNGALTNSLTINQSGSFEVTVTDATGCSGIAVYNAEIPETPEVIIGAPGTLCNGNSATLNASPGLNAYLWSNGQTGASITIQSGGVYEVVAFDAFGCTASDQVVITALTAPSPEIIGTATVCEGSTGNLSLTEPYIEYSWSESSTASSIEVSLSGPYSVTVTAPNGCTGTDTFLFNVQPNPAAQIVVAPYDCSGQQSLEAPTGYSSYSWNTGASGSSIQTDTTGLYSVTITDQVGCTGTAQQEIVIPALPTVAISGNTGFCPGGFTTLTVPAGWASYDWSTGDSSLQLTINSGGAYLVTITDSFGCSATDSVQVAVFASPVVSISGPTSVCPGSTATLNASGNFVAYNWSTGATSSFVQVTPPANLELIATDANGCQDSTSFTVGISNQISTQITSLTYNCNGQLQLEAGAGFQTYSWSTGDSSPSIAVNSNGTYSVSVSDGAGCSGVATIEVFLPLQPTVTISGTSSVCEGNSGQLIASSGFTSYQWSTGSDANSIAVILPGTYQVIATDSNGCTSIANWQFSTQPLPQVELLGSAILCSSASNELSINGSFSQVSWSTGQTGNSINISQPGTYTVTVTDGNGCSNSDNLEVVEGAPVTVLLEELPYNCDGLRTIEASAGFLQYNWSTGGTTSLLTVDQPGQYEVTVTDGNGCTGTNSLFVSIPASPTASIQGGAAFCTGQTSLLTAGGNAISYTWSTGATEPFIQVTTGGTYSLTVSDVLSCTASASISVTEWNNPAPTLLTEAVDCEGTMRIRTTDNYPGYNWSTGAAGPSIVTNLSGNYVVTVTDGNGCTGIGTILSVPVFSDTTLINRTSCDPNQVGTQITQISLPNGCDSVVITETLYSNLELSASISSLTNFNGYDIDCAGAATGGIQVVPTTGVAPFNYLWSTGLQGTDKAENLAAGSYVVTFTDALGCTGTAALQLEAPAPLQVGYQLVSPSCLEKGQLDSLQATGGVAPYQVTWEGQVLPLGAGATLDLSDTLTGGTYALEIADANGCIWEAVLSLPFPDPIVQQWADTLLLKPGESIQLLAPDLSITPLIYRWTPATGLSCQDCLEPIATPFETIGYQLEIEGYPNCSAIGWYYLVLKPGKNLFAPNVIQPEDPNNAGFTLFGDADLALIKTLQIYDRWGGEMAVFQNILPNNPSTGWDGRYRNQWAEPGVYTWWAEIQYQDGSTEIIKGDVTVLR